MSSGKPRHVVLDGVTWLDKASEQPGWQNALADWVVKQGFDKFEHGCLRGFVWWLVDGGYLPDPDK